MLACAGLLPPRVDSLFGTCAAEPAARILLKLTVLLPEMGEMESSEFANFVLQLEGVEQSENSSLDGLPLGNRFQTVVGGASEVDSAQYTGCARLGSSY